MNPLKYIMDTWMDVELSITKFQEENFNIRKYVEKGRSLLSTIINTSRTNATQIKDDASNFSIDHLIKDPLQSSVVKFRSENQYLCNFVTLHEGVTMTGCSFLLGLPGYYSFGTRGLLYGGLAGAFVSVYGILLLNIFPKKEKEN